MKNMATMAG